MIGIPESREAFKLSTERFMPKRVFLTNALPTLTRENTTNFMTVQSITKRTGKSRKSSKGVEMRMRLAESAFELFSENSISSVTLDMIAERASVTKGSLYCHYGSKKELLLEACQCYYRRWEKTVVEYAGVESDPMARLRKVLFSATELCLFDEKNRFFTAQIFVLAFEDKDIKASWADFYLRARNFHAKILEDIRESGTVGIIAPRENADRMLAIMEGIKQQAFFDPEICRPSRIGAVVDSLMRAALEKF